MWGHVGLALREVDPVRRRAPMPSMIRTTCRRAAAFAAFPDRVLDRRLVQRAGVKQAFRHERTALVAEGGVRQAEGAALDLRSA